MIDGGLPDDWPSEVLEAVSHFRQGDLVERPPILYFADTRYPIWEASRNTDTDPGPQGILLDPEDEDAPPYGIILTQTCDLDEQAEPAEPPKRPKQRKQPWFQVAPVYDASEVLDSGQRRQVERHEIGNLVALDGPDLPPGFWVADLRVQLPLEKGCLVGRARIRGFATEEGCERFADHLARRAVRPALANNAYAVVALLREALRSLKKKDRPGVVDPVAEFLLEVEPSRLEVRSARLIVVTEGDSGVAQEWLDQWWAEAKLLALGGGLTLLPNRYTTYDDMSAAEYRRAVPLDFRYLSPDDE